MCSNILIDHNQINFSMPSYFTGIDERVENISSSLVSSLQLSKLSSVSLELVDGCRVESVEIQPDTTLVICVSFCQGVPPVQHVENLLVVVVSPQLADPVEQAEEHARKLKFRWFSYQSNLMQTGTWRSYLAMSSVKESPQSPRF